MSMFDNVVFDEFTLLEGEQAKAYKAKKAAEKEEESRKHRERMNNRYHSGNKKFSNDTEASYKKEYDRRGKASQNASEKAENLRDNAPKNKLFKKKENEKNRKEYEEKLNKAEGEEFNKAKEYGRLHASQNIAKDAIDRHNRRHGIKNESTFSDIEMI